LTKVTTHKLASGAHYTIHPDHRNGNAKKSQWRIPTQKELQVFTFAEANGWANMSPGWGLYIVNDVPCYLGVAEDHQTRVFVAKFVDGNRNRQWHGYPADHQRNNQDVPDLTLLKTWIAQELIPLRKIRKLLRQQPCNL